MSTHAHIPVSTSRRGFCGLGLMAAALAGCSAQQSTQTSVVQQTQSEPAEPEQKLEYLTLNSSVLQQSWNYALYLSDASPQEPLPLIICLHGMDGTYTDFIERGHAPEVLHQLAQETGQQIAALFVDGFNSWYKDQENLPLEQALMFELIPHVLDTFPISTDRRHHALTGISMGGYGSARLAFVYPEICGHIGLMSPAVAIRTKRPAFNFDIPDARADKPLNIYVQTTEDDSIVKVEGVDSFVDELRAHGYEVTYVRDKGQDHVWEYWASVMPDVFTWVMGRFKA